MKARLIVFSVSRRRWLSSERKRITTRHPHKLQRLLDMKAASEKLETNPNEVIASKLNWKAVVNWTNQNSQTWTLDTA